MVVKTEVGGAWGVASRDLDRGEAWGVASRDLERGGAWGVASRYPVCRGISSAMDEKVRAYECSS